jgi:hypothetical protein
VPPPIRRPGLSALLVAGAVVLIVSILIGQKIGDRVLLQTTTHRPILAGSGVTPVPEADPSDRGELKNWKRLQVVSVATDPAFPDPRVTRPPTPPPPVYTPPPHRATPIPEPTIAAPRGIYTSPPLPIPIVSHDPNETSAPEQPPTLPPVTPP